MRRVILSMTLYAIGITAAMAATEPALSIGLPRADFVREVPMNEAQKLLGWFSGRFYLAQGDGAVLVLDKDGHKLMTLQGKDAKGGAVLKHPQAVAVADGYIYVVDSENSLVAMFGQDGKYRASFGERRGGFFSGGSEDELKSPHGIAVYDGIVYVADTGNRRIQLYGENGVYLTALEIEAAAENKGAKDKGLPYHLGEPTDVAVSPQGQIYVLDRDDLLIKVYAQNGAYLRNLPKSGHPVTFSLAADGIYVADEDALVIQKYGFDDKLAYSFGVKGDGRAQLRSVTGLATSAEHQVMIGDSRKGVVDVFLAEAGQAQEELPKRAGRPSVRWLGSQAMVVNRMAWNGKDTLYGVDTENSRLLRVRNGGQPEEVKLGDLAPAAVAVDKAGALWVLDKGKKRVVKLDDAGAIVNSIGSAGSKAGQLDDPADLAISSTGSIFVADPGNDCVQVFNQEGVFLYAIRSSTGGKLDDPVAVALDPQDNIYVLDRARGAVSTFSAKGEPVAEFGKGEGPQALLKPVGLMATQDEVLVLELNVVKVYTHDGHYLRRFAAKGSAAGELEEAAAIAPRDATSLMIAEHGNKRVQTFETLYKPAAPAQLEAKGAVHAVELHWAAPVQSYIRQFIIYRSRNESGGYARIASSSTNQYVDGGLEADGRYFYRVAAETAQGLEGATSQPVQAVAERYTPPVLDHVAAEPTPWQVKLSWKPIDKQYLGAYVIYQKDGDSYTKLGEVAEPEFTRNGLAPDTQYTFYVATRSSDGMESEKCAVTTTTLSFNKAPLEIEVVKLRDIFSNTYKLYEEEGVGHITLTNNTDKPIEKIKVTFQLKNFMDYPTEEKVDKLMPGQSEEITLKAVFNNSILTLSEDSSVQSLIEASYFENGKRVVYSKNPTVKVYDKHRLTWDERGRYASFVTPKDAPVMNFVRAVVTQFKEVHDPTLQAAAVFDALGVVGLTYVPDPSNPYQVSSGKTDTVDYIQYPRETLARKSGDCDDLTAFYSAALESMGIYTLVVEVPGHMFMMFSTGIPADEDGYNMDDMYVIHEGKLWIPVETTLVGGSFVKAWQEGAAAYYKWQKKGSAKLMDVHEAWVTYKPATLPDAQSKVYDVGQADIEKKFPGEFNSLMRITSQTKTRRYQQQIASKPKEPDAYLQVGIILAKQGDRVEAMKYFDKVIELDPKNAAGYNNRANLLMMEEKYAEAQKNYLAATQYGGNDADIWVNLAKSYKLTNNTKKAKEAYQQAEKLDPSVRKKYKALALELLNTL